MFFSTNDDTFKTEIKEFIPASAATTRSKLWPFIEQADRLYIATLLEDDMYTELEAYYQDPVDGGSGSGEDRVQTGKLLDLVQMATINLAYYIGFDVLNVKISDTGFQRSEGQNFKGLYKYQEENLRSYFERTGFNTLDDVLELLENNIEYFPEWEDSENYTILKKSIIPDTRTFDGICFINKSRLIFLRLQRFMDQVIDFSLKPILGETIWDELMAELVKDSPAEKYTKLLPYLQKPLAFLSTALMIENTGSLTDRGLYFEGKNSGFPDNTYSKPGSDSNIDIIAGNNRSTGERYLETLRIYLANNDFESFSGQTGSILNRDNDDSKIFVT